MKRDQMQAVPLHDVSRIETPEQIEIELPLAGVGSRAIAYTIDLLWQAVPIVAALILVLVFLPEDFVPDFSVKPSPSGQPRVPLWVLAFLNMIVFAVNFGYFAFFEIVWKGQTPGKRMLGLRVVRDGGFPLDGRAALVRNLLRVVDSLPTLYLVGMSCLFAGRTGKRVGDYAAGTLVVKELTTKISTMPPSTREGSAEQVRLSPSERILVADFLGRRDRLTFELRDRIGRELASRLALRLGRTAPSDAEAFLQELLRDGDG